ncbi:MAG TPA: orotidine-5'-phosphate decarboxylase [Planctomycetaceae bacterium]|jgi:orotidine-5'-phosphate decarboxylase|nr:orotidine-5'-phosphate decarboxylase [Planctomycetaceae bacterium]
MTGFAERLNQAVLRKQTAALVGLDPRFADLPKSVVQAAEARCSGTRREVAAAAYEEFCYRIIDIVAPLVPAVKPQSAFFEEVGPEGVSVLARVIRKARDAGLIVICDAKRGDIGSTAEAYAAAYLAGEDPDAAPFAADALTVNPYLGRDTLDPYLRLAGLRGAGIYVLVRTSNPGAGTFQDRTAEGRPMYRHVAEMVESLASATTKSGQYGAVGAVVGATYPRELTELREIMPHAPLLVPGYGSQGGQAADVAAAFDEQGLGALVNNARGINFAHARDPYRSRFGEGQWEQAVEAATRDMIAQLAAHTPTGMLR